VADTPKLPEALEDALRTLESSFKRLVGCRIRELSTIRSEALKLVEERDVAQLNAAEQKAQALYANKRADEVSQRTEDLPFPPSQEDEQSSDPYDGFSPEFLARRDGDEPH